MSTHSTQQSGTDGISRRDFARLFAITGSFMLAGEVDAWPEPLEKTPEQPDERFWLSVRKQFLIPDDVGVMNSSEMSPAPASVIEAIYKRTRNMDSDLSFDNQQRFVEGREETRRTVAEFLGVTPEEIVLTRNTSEGSNIVSSGLDLKPGDEVVIMSHNHPSNNDAWKQKAERFGYTVTTINQPVPHPGPEFYIDVVTKAITPRTRVLAFSHITTTVGDILPAKELCRIARERGVLTLVDGAGSLGVANFDLSDMQPDFYSGSAHKWVCGPKEVGVLYINSRVQGQIRPSIIGGHPGGTLLARKMETLGTRNNPSIAGFGEALNFQTKIGRKAIEERTRELRQGLIDGLRRIEGVHVWTYPDPSRSSTVVKFMPGNLDLQKVLAALYQNDRIGGKAYVQKMYESGQTGGTVYDGRGIRFSPHIFNTMAEVDRAVAAVAKYMRQGV